MSTYKTKRIDAPGLSKALKEHLWKWDKESIDITFEHQVSKAQLEELIAAIESTNTHTLSIEQNEKNGWFIRAVSKYEKQVAADKTREDKVRKPTEAEAEKADAILKALKEGGDVSELCRWVERDDLSPFVVKMILEEKCPNHQFTAKYDWPCIGIGNRYSVIKIA